MTSLEKLQSELNNDESILIMSEVSRRYLTGFPSSDGALVITKDKADFYLDSRYEEAARIAQKNALVSKSISIKPYSSFASEYKSNTEIKVIYFEDRRTSVFEKSSLERAFSGKEFRPLGGKIEMLRMVKTPLEIEKIAASQELAEAAFDDILEFISAERTEIEVAARIEYFMKKNGASRPSFDTICVSGSHSSLPHGVPTREKIANDSFVTLDFGCMLDGYASDMTRTVCVGKASKKMKLVYNTVLSAQINAISKVKADVLGSEVDLAARSIITDAGFGKNFGHSTGHGVGLEVHESPSFSPNAKIKVPKNSVLSVEPGIYLEGEFGVRIEDLVVVSDNGCVNLNRSNKELLELN